MRFVTTCVNAGIGKDIDDMVDRSRDISRRTFLKHVDRNNLKEIEGNLGYADHPSKGLTMAGDYHVSYAKSKFRGKPCVFFIWSAIEHVFA